MIALPPSPPPSWDDVYSDFNRWLVLDSKIMKKIDEASGAAFDIVPSPEMLLHLGWGEASYKSKFESGDVKEEAEKELKILEDSLRSSYVYLSIAQDEKTAEEVLRAFKNEATPVLNQMAGRGRGRD